jgi:hypothetical protein
MKNPTLTKNMKHVKLDQIPPLKGPDSQGLRPKRFKTILTLPKKQDRS